MFKIKLKFVARPPCLSKLTDARQEKAHPRQGHQWPNDRAAYCLSVHDSMSRPAPVLTCKVDCTISLLVEERVL
jgi:hypothetical protein